MTGTFPARGKNTSKHNVQGHLADGGVLVVLQLQILFVPTEQARKESMLIMLYGWIQLKR